MGRVGLQVSAVCIVSVMKENDICEQPRFLFT